MHAESYSTRVIVVSQLCLMHSTIKCNYQRAHYPEHTACPDSSVADMFQYVEYTSAMQGF